MDFEKEFLENLVGQWELHGRMGDIVLQQSVEGKWTIGDLFIKLHFTSTLPPVDDQLPYEAIYYIGYNQEYDNYVMHLLDTTQVGITCPVGTAKREGNEIPFQFNYETGPFTNRFIWDPVAGSWGFKLTYFEQDELRTFATKEMVRRTGESSG